MTSLRMPLSLAFRPGCCQNESGATSDRPRDRAHSVTSAPKPGTPAGPLCGRGIAMVGAAVATVVFFTLRPLLTSSAAVLPGTDASNLYAWELYTRSVLAMGRVPHWNPFLFGGT